ncbi:hypothetical protein PR003_g23849 [Phytophthora rubi]|uniref:CCDC66 domain-containing protein n=1 Tax=Phytophthora rubi TaxID=129364 RepID=A0A6A3IWG6_9STRA|nr:hypothetical protein PR002_g22882 [Phytophthora rubi]KAE8986997.1 hypothetical protein PR001_g22449 [Phytophthora rubi]KAE9296057.1 hypothetical protein PR003_g23849 [Phytophthora rubi]
MAQARNSQFWPGQGLAESGPQRALEQSFQPEYAQPEPSGNVHGGRRQRTDIHDGGRGDSEETERFRRKLQQQQEMQLALERQIEEKRQQKLEAKRRQEEEDRREMERFEEDQRRQRAEQECLQAEKRRKAALEQEKAEQAAAAVAAANQQAKLQQQQKFRAQAHQAQPQYHQPQHAQPSHLPPPLQQPEHFTNAPSPSRLRKNPFTNSRAHLFEDPPPQPSPQRGSMIPIDHYGHSNQNASPVRGVHQGFNPIYPQDSQPAFGRSLDPVELRRQYDDMREELHRQKQLVDQLRQAQQQQQQQLSPVRAGNGNIPTLMDLEKLRNELRGELEYREQLHRQELASLKREQQQERGPEHSPRHHPGVRNSIQPAPDKLQQIAPQPETNNYHAPPMWMASADNQRQQQHRRSPTKNLQTSHTGAPSQSEKPIGESLISLRGESEFVYFDGRMAGAGKAAKDHVGPGTKHESDGDSLDQHSKPVEVEESRALEVVRSSVRHSPTKKHSVEKSIAASASTTTLVGKSLLEDADSEDEAQGFVIQSSPIHKQLAPSPTTHARRLAASSHRYSQLPPALTSTSPSKKSGKWRLESMGTNDASDSDGDLDASLDGEQLEALFQRNVRRHEILLGFQTRVQAQTQESNQHEDDRLPQAKSAWTELHQKLENNRRTSVPEQRRKLSTASTSNDSTASQKVDAEDEAALVASSQWLLPIEQATKSSTKLTTLTRNK